MTRTLSLREVAAESSVAPTRLQWMTRIGILKPRGPEAFTYADVFRAKLIDALLKAGFTRKQVQWAMESGGLNLDSVDEWMFDPGPRAGRSFGQFADAVGHRRDLLSAVYSVLGVPSPDPASPLLADEERMFVEFLEGWSIDDGDEAVLRAGRLLGQGTRLTTLGWSDLIDEVGAPAKERLFRGELDRFPTEVTTRIAALIRVAPRMMAWLVHQYLEQRSVEGIVEGFEQFLASRGQASRPRRAAQPSVVFVDLSGYTRLTEDQGDEAAVSSSSTLQQLAEATGTTHGGRLVKLLGDGAMLHLPDASRGVRSAIELVGSLEREVGLRAHAGVHAGPVVQRDRDLFGQTVNLASRLADAAKPGEVLVTEAVVQQTADNDVTFEPRGDVMLRGLAESIRLFVAKES